MASAKYFLKLYIFAFEKKENCSGNRGGRDVEGVVERKGCRGKGWNGGRERGSERHRQINRE